MPVAAGDVEIPIVPRVSVLMMPVAAGDVEIPIVLMVSAMPVAAGDAEIPIVMRVSAIPVAAGDVEIPLPPVGLTLNGLNARMMMIRHANDLIFAIKINYLNCQKK